MKRLSTFFENPFLKDDEISIDKFKKFSEDHLARITGSSNKEVLALVAATGAAHLAFFGDIADLATAQAVQQSRTKSMNGSVKDFISLVRKEEPGIAYAFGGRDAAEYQEFFPHGLTEYSEATLGNIETLMERFEGAATTHKSTVRATLYSDVATIRASYDLLRGKQLGQKGATSTERDERNGSKELLARQIWYNMLTIARAYIDDAAGGLGYFDEGILR